jgi:hypothetical protein
LRGDQVVISVATDDEYRHRLRRLEESLHRQGYAGATIFWTGGDLPPGCPQHQDIPYAFKPFGFAEARRLGFRSALWMDASCVAIRPLAEHFGSIRRQGYLVFRNGGNVGQWSSDLALARYAMSRDRAMAIPEVNSAALGLDFEDESAVAFLEWWLAAAREGSAFRGLTRPVTSPEDAEDVKWNRSQTVSRDPRVLGHRHDQTVAGLLAHRLDMTLTEGIWAHQPGDAIETGASILIARDEAPR